jgi:hypothetical protein
MAHPRIVSRGAAARALERIRKLVLALPETVEKEAWGRPTFRVKGKMFLMFVDDQPMTRRARRDAPCGSDGRLALWLQCTHEEQEAAVEADGERCFAPPYVGPSGWLGVRLDRDLPWPLVEAQVLDAWRRAAPARVRALLDAPAAAPAPPAKAAASRTRRSPPAATPAKRKAAARSPRRNA